MSYTPNINDPRVQRRIRHALGFVRGVLSDTEGKSWSTRYIDQYLGSQRNDLSKWLRNQLLIVTDDRWNKDTKLCKKYRLNTQGYEYVKSMVLNTHSVIYPIVVEVDKTLVKQTFESKHKQELETLDFKYKEQSNRLWHPLQNIRSEYRRDIFADHGLVYQFDISCCAPTLIYQYSQQCGNDEYLFALKKYLANKEQIRQEIADAAEIDLDVAKKIINALFAGAVIANSPEKEIYHLLEGDAAKIKFLQQHEFICELKADIKTCWDYIKTTLPRRGITTKTGRTRLLGINSKQKWGVYFELERRVMKSVNEYLTMSGNKCFLEHDGWTCQSDIDLDSLREYVRNNTGFDIKVEKS